MHPKDFVFGLRRFHMVVCGVVVLVHYYVAITAVGDWRRQRTAAQLLFFIDHVLFHFVQKLLEKYLYSALDSIGSLHKVFVQMDGRSLEGK